MAFGGVGNLRSSGFRRPGFDIMSYRRWILIFVDWIQSQNSPDSLSDREPKETADGAHGRSKNYMTLYSKVYGSMTLISESLIVLIVNVE